MPLGIVNYILHPSSGGKFVVLRDESDSDSGVVVFSDFTRDFQHHDIVVRWQERNGVAVEGAGFRVAGGGWWKLEGDLLVLYGQSAAYGRFDPVWLRSLLVPGTILTESRIDVR